MNSIYEDKFRLRISDFDCHDHLTPHAVLDLFQDVAGKHADLIGVGYNDFIKRDLIWVLVRTKYDVIHNPDLYSVVKVSTWPKKKGRVDFDREYEIRDENDNILVKGISKWVVVNAKSRRIYPSRDIDYACEIEKKENYPASLEKLEDFSIEGLDYSLQNTSYCDLDHNGHVNNANYARYIFNTISLNQNEVISSFEINYLKEMTLNFQIKVYYKRASNFIFCKGVNLDNETIFIARIGVK